MWHTNAWTAIRQASQEGDTLIVGALMGAAAAAFYRVAKQFASLLQQFGTPIQQAIYPDLARLWSEGKVVEFRHAMQRTCLISGGGALVLFVFIWVFSDILIAVIVGEDYLPSANVLIVHSFVYVVWLAGIAILPTMTSMNRSGESLRITIVCTVLFFSLLPFSLNWLGVIGASVAHIAFGVVWWILSMQSISRHIGKRLAPAA